MKTIQPRDLCLGNFISSFGETVMVTGITPHPSLPGEFYISHSGNNNSPLPDGVEYSPTGIPLTDKWKKVLCIDQYQFPEWIEYVHQAQNYLYFFAGVYLVESITDWGLIPKNKELN